MVIILKLRYGPSIQTSVSSKKHESIQTRGGCNGSPQPHRVTSGWYTESSTDHSSCLFSRIRGTLPTEPVARIITSLSFKMIGPEGLASTSCNSSELKPKSTQLREWVEGRCQTPRLELFVPVNTQNAVSSAVATRRIRTCCHDAHSNARVKLSDFARIA